MAVSDLKNPGSSDGNGSFGESKSERSVNYKILGSGKVAHPISSGIITDPATRY